MEKLITAALKLDKVIKSSTEVWFIEDSSRSNHITLDFIKRPKNASAIVYYLSGYEYSKDANNVLVMRVSDVLRVVSGDDVEVGFDEVRKWRFLRKRNVKINKK